MDTTFKIGDVVILKSGKNHSPVMVIKNAGDENSICIWFNGTTNQFEEKELPNDALEKI